MDKKNVFFEHVCLTKKSYGFSSAVISGKQMRFTKAQIGDGEIQDGIDITELTELINYKKNVDILSVRGEGSQVVVDIKINSANITEAFTFREIGIYAEIEGEEILYAYLNSGSKFDYLTPAEDGQVFNQNLQFIIAVGRAENVEVIFNNTDIPAGSITIDMLDNGVKTFITSVRDSFNEHKTQSVLNENGIHGIRIDETSNNLQFKKDDAWQDISTGQNAESLIDNHVNTKVSDENGTHGITYDEDEETLKIVKQNGEISNFKFGVDPDLFMGDLVSGLDECLEKVGRTND